MDSPKITPQQNLGGRLGSGYLAFIDFSDFPSGYFFLIVRPVFYFLLYRQVILHGKDCWRRHLHERLRDHPFVTSRTGD